MGMVGQEKGGRVGRGMEPQRMERRCLHGKRARAGEIGVARVVVVEEEEEETGVQLLEILTRATIAQVASMDLMRVAGESTLEKRRTVMASRVAARRRSSEGGERRRHRRRVGCEKAHAMLIFTST